MQYVRSIAGSVTKTYNSINPATLSGAIDVIVVEQENGDLACSPFHVRFGKWSLLRPLEKKVEFRVNGEKTNFPMKLGEGGEAFFVFETTSDIPEDLQTSPLVSPAASPRPMSPVSDGGSSTLGDPEVFDLEDDGEKSSTTESVPIPRRAQSDAGQSYPYSLSPPNERKRPQSGEWKYALDRSTSADILPSESHKFDISEALKVHPRSAENTPRSSSPLSDAERHERAKALSQKIPFPSKITDDGDLMLDMHGYKTGEEDALAAEVAARRILAEEFESGFDLASLVGADAHGNIIIYTSEEAKAEADRRAQESSNSLPLDISDIESGYSSDDNKSMSVDQSQLATPPGSPPQNGIYPPQQEIKHYAKTLRLTSTQLKSLNLKLGANTLSFSVNKAVCTANLWYWKYDVPIVISDIDGTITKSDALGHFYNMLGRDWTHLGVAKLFTEIVGNGYNIIYLTSRSVGQADTTRNYLNGIVQDKYKLPKGPVIMSPDRTLAALRREVYLRKPEVFKMACLRDIMSLFGDRKNPFYAGFGNRLTDALSYRSVNIPSTRIYTIDSNGSVILDLLTLTSYKSTYVNMRDDVDKFFPPISSLPSDETFNDFNFWRSTADYGSFSDSEDEEDEEKDDYDHDYDEDEEELEGADYFEGEAEVDDEAQYEDAVDGEEELGDSMISTFSDGRQYDDALGGSMYMDPHNHQEEEERDEHTPQPEESRVDEQNAKFDNALQASNKGHLVEYLLEKDKQSRAADMLRDAYGDTIPELEAPGGVSDAGAAGIDGLHVADPRVLEAQDDIIHHENLGLKSATKSSDDSSSSIMQHVSDVVDTVMHLGRSSDKMENIAEEESGNASEQEEKEKQAVSATAEPVDAAKA